MKKVILITGAASGVGRYSALKLINEGHVIYGGDINFNEMQDLEQMGMHRLYLDVTDEKQCKNAAIKVFKEQGRIDGVFANAGYTCIGMFELVSIEDAKKQFDVNVFGVASIIKSVLPYMRNAGPKGKGHIVITSSIASKISMPGMGWYPSSKYAVNALGDALRREMRCLFPNIKVVLIEPGEVNTDIYRASRLSWHKAMEHSEAEVYRETMENLLSNFKKGIDNGLPVEKISKVVSEIFNSANPKKRYRINSLPLNLLNSLNSLEDTDTLDDMLIRQMLLKSRGN
jgi:NADP-dependent 3-hydroxy acid dehydrogenase YdfG